MSTYTLDDFRVGIDRRRSELVADDLGLVECKNAYVTTGYAIAKRPGLDKITATAMDPFTQGLFIFDGHIYTVSHTGASNPGLSGYGIGGGGLSSTIRTLFLPNPDDAGDNVKRVWQFLVFNRKLYVVVEYDSGTIRHFYPSGSASEPYDVVDAITDPNCPNTKSVVVQNSKIYAIGPNTAGNAYVKYSATEKPRDWTSPKDASGTLGLPVGLESPDQDEIVALGTYKNSLIVFMTNNIQLWNTDTDPINSKLSMVVENAYTNYPNSIAKIGPDVIFLNKDGFNSVSQMLYTDDAQAVDIGAAIDDIVTPHLASYDIAYPPKSIHYSGYSQFMCIVEKQIFVFTFSKASDVHAWSRYTTADAIADIAPYRNYCFLRCTDASGDDYIYSFNPDAFQDGFSTQLFDMEITNSYQTLRAAGRWKKIYGMDVLFNGVADFQHRYDARSPTEKTVAISLSGDSRPGQLIPVELMTTELSFDINQTANSTFQLNNINYYFDPLGHF
jgi:hypothetical protein